MVVTICIYLNNTVRVRCVCRDLGTFSLLVGFLANKYQISNLVGVVNSLLVFFCIVGGSLGLVLFLE